MRAILLVAALAACGGSAHPTQSPLPADPAAARGEVALRFLRAVAARDHAAMDAVVDVHGFCAAGVKVKGGKVTVDQCADEMAKGTAAAYPGYEAGVPAGAVLGATTEYPIDEKQGIYQINVDVPGSPEGQVAVILIELDGRPYVVFPIKKGD